MAVIVALVLGLTHSVVALAGRLADEYAGYQGQWRLGIRMDRLRGAVPLDLLQNLFGQPGKPVQPRRVREGHIGIDRGNAQRTIKRQPSWPLASMLPIAAPSLAGQVLS